jgi:uncharacterized protein DUF5670
MRNKLLRRSDRATCAKGAGFPIAPLSSHAGQTHQGDSLMLRTIFFLAVMVWMLGLALQFGGSALHLLLVVAAIMLVMKYTLLRRSFY